MTTYIEAIGQGFPLVQAHCAGDGSVYSNIVWDGGEPIPSQATLDAWIAANPLGSGTMITVLAFRNRFTQAEKIAIELASIDNPTATMQQRQFSASLRVMTSDLAVAKYIDLSRPDTQAAVTALETYGVIGAGRASQILTSPITAAEKPTVF